MRYLIICDAPQTSPMKTSTEINKRISKSQPLKRKWKSALRGSALVRLKTNTHDWPRKFETLDHIQKLNKHYGRTESPCVSRDSGYDMACGQSKLQTTANVKCCCLFLLLSFQYSNISFTDSVAVPINQNIQGHCVTS